MFCLLLAGGSARIVLSVKMQFLQFVLGWVGITKVTPSELPVTGWAGLFGAAASERTGSSRVQRFTSVTRVKTSSFMQKCAKKTTTFRPKTHKTHAVLEQMCKEMQFFQ